MNDSRKVLFVTIHFREYIHRIKDAISEELHAKVDVVFSDYHSAILYSVIGKIFGNRMSRRVAHFIQSVIFSYLAGRKYDYIFVLVGRGIHIESFQKFMKGQNKAKKILYLWDDVERVEEFHKLKDEFDDIVSFDRVDCENLNLRFLPLFFCEDYRYDNERKDIDFSSIGGLHTYREALLSKLMKKFPLEEYRWYSLLSTTFFHMIKLKLSGNKQPFFVKTKEMKISEAADIAKRSKIIIDMPYLSQKGLSIRTIESLAAQAKLITTNQDVIHYDFYNENNIFLLTLDDLNIPADFIRSAYIPVAKEITENYSLTAWIHNLFLI